MAQQEYDAIVVGSGVSGGWAAKELTERGLNTLMLEAGRPVDPERDYTEHEPTWEYKFRGLGDRKYFSERQPMQSQAGPVTEFTRHWFVDDIENPYTFDEDKPFLWIRGRHVGGRSIMWGRQVYRWGDFDFEANAREGVAIDWPIRYADIESWYDHVENFIGISGRAEGVPHLPDGRFLPPMEMNCVEQHTRERVSDAFGGERLLTIGRCAILTREHQGRAACHYCGPCDRGCITRSYFSTLNSTLPVAMETGRLTLRPYSVVHSVIYDEERDRASGVRVIDALTRRELEFHGRIIFLCASTLESTRILLNSSTSRFPDGLANSSGQLGRNLMDHTMGGGALGRFPDFGDHERHAPFGRRPNGIYMPRFRNISDSHPDFTRGYGYQGGGYREGWDRGTTLPGFGVQLKNRLRDPGDWIMRFVGFGECLPNPDNYVALDPEKVDKWGIPALRIHCAWGENERAMVQDMSVAAAEMLEAAGAVDIESWADISKPGEGIHEMGTARMGRDPKTSVLNEWNQTHDVKNLFVTDGSCMTSSACQNPSITYMALTARACAHAVERMNRKEL